MNGYKTIALSLFLLTALIFSQIKEGDVAPEFDGTLVNGKHFFLHETVTDSIAVIFSMGYNCGLCKTIADELENSIYRKYGD